MWFVIRGGGGGGCLQISSYKGGGVLNKGLF